jgi:hypothetical protein
VELAVQPVHQVEVAVLAYLGGLQVLASHPLELVQLVVRRALRGEPGREALDFGAQVEYLLELGIGPCHHPRTLVGSDLDQALGSQVPQRFSHRGPADTDGLSQV